MAWMEGVRGVQSLCDGLPRRVRFSSRTKERKRLEGGPSSSSVPAFRSLFFFHVEKEWDIDAI